MCELDRLRDIPGEHGCREAVERVVGLSKGIVLMLEFDNDADWPEYLFLDDAHVRAGVGEDSRLDPEALSAMALTAEVHRRAVFLARIDIVHDALSNSVIKVTERQITDMYIRHIESGRLGDPGTSHLRKDRRA